MKRKKIVVSAFLFLLLSLSVTTTNLFADDPEPGCYFCLHDGTPFNLCYEASGSGWTHCREGSLHCALGGTSCISN
jgi:hypothetical protein